MPDMELLMSWRCDESQSDIAFYCTVTSPYKARTNRAHLRVLDEHRVKLVLFAQLLNLLHDRLDLEECVKAGIEPNRALTF